MKNYAIALFSALIFACGGGNDPETTTDFSNITFQMDTVVVDPGEEIINLKFGLWSSIMSDDNSKLYLWDNQASTLDIIDIDGLELNKKVKFEKEGPNGVGSYVAWMSLLGNDNILMANFNGMNLFDLEGNKLRAYELNKDKFEGDALEDGENFYLKSIITDEGNAVYGMMGGWTNENESFAKVDFKTNEVKKLKLPGIEALPDYKIMLKSKEMSTIMGTDKNLKKIDNRIIFSNSAFNTLYIIDTDKDSVYQVNYESKLTAKAKKGGYPEEVYTDKDFRDLVQQISEEVNFQAPMWDAKNKRFYRFSYETTPKDNSDGPNADGSEKKSLSKIYLSFFDKDFNFLGEAKLNELNEIPNYAFVKDGKIWYYVNVDDELGFVRLSFDGV